MSTPRLRLRSWRDADLAPFARLNADPEVMRYMTGRLDAAQSDALARRLQAAIEAQGWGLWAVELRPSGEFAGFVGLNRPAFAAHFTPCVEIAWRLAREHWGCGYATEAARACLDFGFRELGLAEIVAFTVPANARSRTVMVRLGMRHDAAGDFGHPQLPPWHPLRPHVLYRLAAAEPRADDA